MQKANIAKKIMDHPDSQEILTKLIAEVSSSDISEWLCAKYLDNEKKFRFSKKEIDLFKDNYLDFYTIIRNDVASVKLGSAEDQLNIELQKSPEYHKALEKYIDNEVDIKTTIKKMIVNIELRASQVFDSIQNDQENTKGDRILIEWFNTLVTVLEKYNDIVNFTPEQINIQNNIIIQLVDNNLHLVSNIIKEFLSKPDYNTSLLFIEMFNEEMKKLKGPDDKIILPQEVRMVEAKVLNETIRSKLEKQ